jgi:hypothetical protein
MSVQSREARWERSQVFSLTSTNVKASCEIWCAPVGRIAAEGRLLERAYQLPRQSAGCPAAGGRPDDMLRAGSSDASLAAAVLRNVRWTPQIKLIRLMRRARRLTAPASRATMGNGLRP